MSLLSERELRNLCVELIKENVKLKQMLEIKDKMIAEFRQVAQSEELYKNFIIAEKSFIDKYNVK